MSDYAYSSRPPRGTSGGDASVAVALGVMQIVLAVVLTLIAFLEQFNVDACGFSRECDFELLSASMFITPLTAASVLLIEGIAAVLLLRQGRRIWWVLTIGTVVVIAGYVLAHVLNCIATGVA